MVQAPIFHVNGDDPEACVRVARLAFDYRQAFHKDVVIDMLCYRRHGHNEADDPSYTQPLMYRRIDARRSVRKLYTEVLVKRGDISLEEAEAALDDFQQRLQVALDETRSHAPDKPIIAAEPPKPLGVLPHIETGAPLSEIDKVFSAIDSPPEGFKVHPKLAKQFDARRKMFREDDVVDWALGEALAFGTLLDEGHSVRLSGEDTRRGTFSHRHGVLVDYDTGDEHIPLLDVANDGAQFWLYDSLLSEFAALGFEYGYSIVNKDALIIWEGQFGDFMNGAQVIIDQFIVAAEDKWDQCSQSRHAAPPRLRGPGTRALLRTNRALPHPRRRGQHPGLQLHHRCPVLPSPAPSGQARDPQAPHRLHPQVGPARQADSVQGRRPHPRVLRGGPRRRRGHRCVSGPAGRVRLRQDRLRGPGGP